MMKMNLEEMLAVAYKVTHEHTNGGKITMSSNSAKNQSLFTQTFTLTARPYNNRVPRNHKSGGTIVSSAVGYKELIVWVYFGDNEQWFGPSLRWLYMDRSARWDGEHKQGDLNDMEALLEISEILKGEIKRISDIEWEYHKEHGNLEGLMIDGYADPNQ